MKKLILLLVVMVAFASCKPDKEFKMDPNATVVIKVASVQTRSGQPYLTPIEMVEQAEGIMFYNVKRFGEKAVGRGFSSNQRDYVTPALKMWGTDIIDEYGDIVPDFIESEDCILRKITNLDQPNMIIDTIAYIPNSIMRSAEIAIKEAHQRGDMEAIYALFHDAFMFVPIHGYEWRELREQGLN